MTRRSARSPRRETSFYPDRPTSSRSGSSSQTPGSTRRQQPGGRPSWSGRRSRLPAAAAHPARRNPTSMPSPKPEFRSWSSRAATTTASRRSATPSPGGCAPAVRSCPAPGTPCRARRASTSCSRASSEDRQKLLDLVRRDLHPVVLPLLPLDLDEAVEGVLAEDAKDELGLRGELDRLSQRLRQLLDAAALALLGSEVVEVLLHRLGQLVAMLDALEPGVQHRREAEVGVAGRVGAAELGPRRLLLARVVERHADQSGAVPPRPGEIDRCLIAGNEPLVGVHPLGEERSDLAGVLEL